MTGLVIDASVMLRWFFADEDEVAADLLRRVLADELVVPAHWQSELANGILVAEKRSRSRPSDVERLDRLLVRLKLEVDGTGADDALGRILPLARAHRLTVYDAIYLELAERRGLSLATYDEDLAKAAASVGLQVVGYEVTT